MNDFYTLSDTRSTENSWTGTLAFNPHHAIFNGHFPQQPVVPGVCMMQIVKEVLEMIFDKEIYIKQAGQVKFLQLITPEVTPTINLTWVEADGEMNVTANFKTDRDLFKMNAKMKVSETF